MSIFGNLSSWTIFDCLNSTSDTLVAQLVKNLPAVWETWVWSLGWEDRLEKGKAAHSIILAWRIPWTVWSMGSPRVGDNWETSPSPRAEEDEEDRETLESDYLEFECARLLSGFSRVRFFATPWTTAARLLCPWDSPGKTTGVGGHALLQGTFPTQGLNPCLPRLLHQRQILYCWATGEAQSSNVVSTICQQPDPGKVI